MEKMKKVRKARQPKEAKTKAMEFYIMGLTALEVSTLTGIPKRTLERYMMEENWRTQRHEAKEAEKEEIVAEYLRHSTAKTIYEGYKARKERKIKQIG